ncbi:MAG: diguanylate cyclase [Desulfotalea sp.]
MIKIDGYTELTTIYEGKKSRVLRGVCEATGEAVAIKMPAALIPSGTDLAVIEKEYQFLKSLDVQGIPKAIDRIEMGNSLALIVEYFDYPSLRSSVADLKLTTAEGVTVFEKVTAILHQLHSRSFIHRDITPSNILYDRKTGNVALVDYGFSTDIPAMSARGGEPEIIEGTLHYMSPEQTGRINRSLDHRSDFYSLGVALYEVLTGLLPFASEDLGEIIHCHIATEPMSPIEISADIPQVLSDIVMRCMEKDAKSRYQSAKGLHHDLLRCLNELEETGSIAPFPIGEADRSDKFTFPERLFGRDDELQTLHKHYQQVVKGNNAIVMITGQSGVGKTSLVQELNRTVVSGYGYIIYGKYDPYNRNKPYSGLTQAFTFLIKQILTENNESIVRWKTKIVAALGDNGSIITDLIPELVSIIGKQALADILAPADARTRLKTVFSNFIQTFGSPSQPLVVFLDDLQWIDNSSLALIELFGSMKSGSAILFVGAYRSNEVSESHPLTTSIETLNNQGANIAEVCLEPLGKDAVSEFISETLFRPVSDLSWLDAMIFDKTAGNPLFFRTMLTSLKDEGHISFDYDAANWTYDIEAIKVTPYAENVVEALQAKIGTLPEKSVEILRLGACTGTSFTLDLLSHLAGCAKQDIALLLKPAIAGGLVSSSRSDFELYLQEQADVMDSLTYQFTHDRIQQAAYDLLEESRRPALHLKVGRVLMGLAEDEQTESHLFDIATHMQKGVSLLTNKEERYQVATLMLQAGIKAKLSTAFLDATELLGFSHSLLVDNTWLSHYELTINIHIEYAEALSLSAKYDEAEALYCVIADNLTRAEDRLWLYNVKVKQYHYQAKFAEAVDIEFEGLALMDINIPQSDDDLMPFFGAEMEKIGALLENKQPEDFYNAPENSDELFSRKLELLFDLFADSYLMGRGLLCGVTSAVMARLSMENGNNQMASVSYINYASTLCALGSDYPKGYAFGSLAVKLAEKYHVPALQNYTYHVFSLAVNHWHNPLESSHDYWTKASRLALASGSPYAGYVFLQLAHVLLASGTNLDLVEQQIARSQNFLEVNGLDAIITLLDIIVHQPVRHLRDRTNSVETLDDENFNTEELLETFKELPFFTGSLYYSMLRVASLSGDILPIDTLQEWITMIDNTQQGQIMLADSYFFYVLLLIDGRRAAGEDDILKYQEFIDIGIAKMENWASHCKANFDHKYDLLCAEDGNGDQGLDSMVDQYDNAILKALENSFMHDAALAAEKAGKFWISRGKPYVAKSYIEQACIYYARWGAICKVDQLREQFSEYLTYLGSSDLTTSFRETLTINPFVTSSLSFSASLDLSCVTKATQAVSKHIVMDDLGRDLVSIAIENAGASKGLLMVKNNDGFKVLSSISSIASIRTPGPTGMLFTESEELSIAVINYVIRTGKTIVMDDAPANKQFAQCSYIKNKKISSICCIPIKRQAEVKAVLYLENQATTGVFREDRLQTLEILAAQATISMENAMMYQELLDLNKNQEEIIMQRTKELHEKNIELEYLSTTDQLTGAFNRRRLDEELAKEVSLCKRYNKSVSVIIFDVDKFKLVNDTYGHSIGDDVLVKLASIISENVRSTDIFGRWGGEEFLIIIPEFSQKSEQVAEKLRAVLESTEHPTVGIVTASLGVSWYQAGDTASSLVSRADDALYRAKEKGRNRVETAR